MGAHSQACHSGARDFPELHVYSRGPLGLVNVGFHFGRVGMRCVEVACVSNTLTPSFPQVPQSAWGLILKHATPAPVISQSCTSIPEVLGPSERGIPFWARWHALRRSGMRDYNPHPLICTGASDCSGAHSHDCLSGALKLPELRVYSRGPLGLVNLGFHFGRVAMRYVEVACVSTTLTPWFAQVPQCAVGLILTYATPAPRISRSCASIPEVRWVW